MSNNETKEMTFNFSVGDDNGNSEHDIIIDGYKIAQPNVLAKVPRLPMLDEVNVDHTIKHIQDKLIVDVTSTSCSTGTYYIGKYALHSGEKVRNIAVGFDNDKVDCEIIYINTLAQIAGRAVALSYENNKNAEKSVLVNVDMTTGLPTTQYNKKAADEMAAKFIKGKHTVNVHVGNLRYDVNVHFNYVKVLPESVPATFSIINKKKAKDGSDKETIEKYNKTIDELFKEFKEHYKLDKVDGDYFKGKRILHVGIGEGTTEYPITNGIEFDPNFLHGSNNGVGHAIDASIQNFADNVGLRTYSRQDFSEVLRDKTHKYYAAADETVEPNLENESEDIFRHAKMELERSNNNVDVIMVYGGGSILMKKYLMNKLQTIADKAQIKLFYVPSDFAVMIEADGMYEFTNSKIFKVLKERYEKQE